MAPRSQIGRAALNPPPSSWQSDDNDNDNENDNGSGSDSGDDVESNGGNSSPHRRSQSQSKKAVLFAAKYARVLPLTISLPLLVFVDMFAVSLVIPLLFQYYKAAGISSANQREFLQSIFSGSQIVGGLLISVLSDAGLLQRRTILFLSFGGSALSYALIVQGSFTAIVISRVTVGLVKQTMTVCQTLLTVSTTEATRATYMGRLTAAATVAWIIGPTVGALLFQYVDPGAPAWTACVLFVINLVLASILLRGDDEDSKVGVRHKDHDSNHTNDDYGRIENSMVHGNNTKDIKDTRAAKPAAKPLSILAKLKTCFSSKALGSVVATQLILVWVTKATSYSQLGSFYEDMYDLEPYHRGYISSYQGFLQFIVQSALVGPILHWSGGERRTTCIFTGILAVAVFFESLQSLPLFLIVLCPILSLCFSMTSLSLQTMVTHVAPAHSIFSVLAALDVLQNAVSVSVPFYRAILFGLLAKDTGSKVTMQGDPDPIAWVMASSIHWVVAAAAMTYLLFSCHEDGPKKKKGT
jgi:predicted MFS family arabinose efflux permease